MSSYLLLTASFLFIAIFPGIPYFYYELLRLWVFIAASIVSWKYYNSNLPQWAIIFLFIGLLFNPIIPIHLNKLAWVPLDFICSMLFIITSMSLKKKVKK